MKPTRPRPEQLALLSLEEIQMLLMSLFDVVEQREARITQLEEKRTNANGPVSSDRLLKGSSAY